MNCPNCGFKVNENENFCRSCGTRVRQTSQNDSTVENNINKPNTGYDYHSQFQNVNNVQDINNPGNNYYAELIDAYIGKNADKIKSGKFSWPSFFFGVLYVLYRKMWLLWLIIVAISAVASLIIPLPALIEYIISGIIIGLIFNKVYVNKVRKKVEKIVRENPGKTKEELKTICSKKGGTTIIPVVIIVGLYLAITVIAAIIIKGVIDDVKDSAAQLEAPMIVSGINNYCAVAAMKEQLDGTTNPCTDGVDTTELTSMVDLGNASVSAITYTSGKVSALTVSSNGRTVTYDGTTYTFSTAAAE